MNFMRRAAATVEETGRSVSSSAQTAMTSVLLACIVVLAVALAVVVRATI